LETPRLRLREVHGGDAAALRDLFADREVMAHYWDVLTPAAPANWLAAHTRLYASHGYAPWTVELHDGTFVGQCGPLPHEIDGKREVEVICFMKRAYWRGGHSDEACRASIRYAFERIGVERVVALILPANRPSRRLAIRCGLRFERDIIKDGFPMLLYAITRDEFVSATRKGRSRRR
jgi:RimJ/RimL family protein N-acetyltransferase